jgi:hypothetical protein
MSQRFIEEGSELLRRCVVAMVDRPEVVKITTYQGDKTIVFYVDVDKSDLGKVIGRVGRNAKALRELLGALAGRYHVRAVMEIVEDGNPNQM